MIHNSVFSVGSWLGLGSAIRKLIQGSQDFQTSSDRSPSSLGACVTRTVFSDWAPERRGTHKAKRSPPTVPRNFLFRLILISRYLTLFSHLKRPVEFFHLVDDSPIFKLTVVEHRGAGKALLPNVGSFLRYLISDPIPVGMIEGVCRFRELSLMDAKGLTADNRRTVEVGYACIHSNGHQ